MYGAIAAASALDHPTRSIASLQGSRDQVVVTARVVAATTELMDVLADGSTSLARAMDCVDAKNKAATNFSRHTGVRWPL